MTLLATPSVLRTPVILRPTTETPPNLMMVGKINRTFAKGEPNTLKQFGFITLANGGMNVFFHYSKLLTPACDGGDQPTFNDWGDDRHPEVGDEVMVTAILPNAKGPMAKTWMFKDELDHVLKEIDARPLFRLMEQRGPKKYGKKEPFGYEKPAVQWEGKNLDELRQKWTKPWDTRVTDQATIRRWFEVFHHDTGEWEQCDDPRS